MIRLPCHPHLLLVAVLLCLVATACGDEPTPAPPAATAQATTPLVTASTGIDKPDSTSGTLASTATATVRSARIPDLTATPAPASTPLSLPTPRPIEQASPPVRLRIPALGIDAVVQWVGVDAEGRMDVPSNYTDVAWYEHGASPGTPGNAVIAGHLDSTTGPAIFYRLEDLQPGDEIITTTADGQEFRFVVTTSEVYDADDDAPLDRIFGTAVNPQLNLITCDGAFDSSSRQYDKRLVVYTELANGS